MIKNAKQKCVKQPKGTEMSIPEFLNFRKLAMPKISFSCDIWHGKYFVECDRKFMSQVGY